MSGSDYYQILGVSKGVSEGDLKKAYRRMALKYHPDQNKGDKGAEAKFKEISEAYEVLKDSQKRAAYDRMGHQAFKNGASAGGPGGPGGPGFGQGGFEFNFRQGGGGQGGFDMFEDIFEELMGRGGRGRRGATGADMRTRGADLRFDMTLSLEEAYAGLQTDITIPTHVSCGDCKGKGSKTGGGPVACGACGGRGVITTQQGFFVQERTCGSCSGAGYQIKDPCKTCAGHGRVRQRRQLRVSIPAGIEDESRVRISGEGEVGMRGGPAGDLYIFVSLKPHKFFKRQGRDLLCEVMLPMTKATLGGSIDVPTIEGGQVRVSVPEGTQSGHKFRVRMKGMSAVRSTLRGDLYVEVQVETPVHLTAEQKDLLRQFDEKADAAKVQPKASRFWAGIKSLFD